MPDFTTGAAILTGYAASEDSVEPNAQVSIYLCDTAVKPGTVAVSTTGHEQFNQPPVDMINFRVWAWDDEFCGFILGRAKPGGRRTTKSVKTQTSSLLKKN
jgi:hypothetical protein